MNILAVDTAGRSASVALLRDDTLLYETVCNCGLTHSETLMPMVDAALKTAGLHPEDIELYAVTAGPGSFTGLRIGMSAVKGMALVHQTPCAGVSTLEALARCHTGEGVVVCAMDARRGQVYWAAFDLETHQRLTPDAAAPRRRRWILPGTVKKAYFLLATAPRCVTILISRRSPVPRRWASVVPPVPRLPRGKCGKTVSACRPPA